MALEVFNRTELKYLIPFSMYEKLAAQLMAYCRYDALGDGCGRYNIVSLYFDSNDHKIYYETRNKLRFRQKLRLRVYDETTVNDDAFFEVKQKFNNVVNKRRTKIKLARAYEYLYGQDSLSMEGMQVSNPQIMNEVTSFKQLYNLHPAVIVSYDRQAFHGLYESDLRVTFDYNLKCRNDDLHIENGPRGSYFVDPELVILEVKVSQSVPFWLARMLSELECPKKSVSKFCTSMDVCQVIADDRMGERHSSGMDEEGRHSAVKERSFAV